MNIERQLKLTDRDQQLLKIIPVRQCKTTATIVKSALNISFSNIAKAVTPLRLYATRQKQNGRGGGPTAEF